MAPAKSKKQPPKRAASSADSDDDEQSQSQGTSQVVSTETIQACVRKQQEQAKTRRAQREQEIEANRKQRISKVHAKMNECRRAHEASIHSARKPTLDRLRTLLSQKRDLENQLDRCYQKVDLWQERTIQQIQVALAGKLEDLKD